jgi:hypothetical protein
MTGWPGKAPPTGVPPVHWPTTGASAGMTFMIGVATLLGSCVFLSIGTAVEGGGCLVSFAIICGVIGLGLAIKGGRALFGDSVDNE